MHFIMFVPFFSAINLRVFQKGLGVGVLFLVSPHAWIRKGHVFHFLSPLDVNLYFPLFKKKLLYHIAPLSAFPL